MAFRKSFKQMSPSQQRVARAQRRVNTLVDRGVAFNPKTLNSQSLSRAANNAGAIGLSGSADAAFITSRPNASVSAPRPRRKKKS